MHGNIYVALATDTKPKLKDKDPVPQGQHKQAVQPSPVWHTNAMKRTLAHINQKESSKLDTNIVMQHSCSLPYDWLADIAKCQSTGGAHILITTWFTNISNNQPN